MVPMCRFSLLCWLSLCIVPGSAAVAQELNWAQKMFEKQNIDFGVVARGADVSHRLKIKNVYEKPVHIANVGTSCGCSAAKPNKDTLAPGEEAYIEVSMDTQRFMRRKDSAVIVNFDQPLAQEVRIPLTVYIRTDVVLTPGSVNFGAVDVGAAAERKVEIAYAGREDWRIRDIQSGNSHIAAKVVETARGNGRVAYDLFVMLKPDAPVGAIRDHLTLLTDDANSPQVPVLVEGRVEADITVTPELVSLGTLAPGQSKLVNVVLRGKKPFLIDKIECEHETGAFKVRLPKDAKAVHVLPLTFVPPNEPGEIQELFTVTIPGRAEPVTFKAQGRIVAGTVN